MNLYIETENGTIKNHPAFEDNLIQAFGEVPTHWEAFVRVEQPVPTTYQILEFDKPTYAKVDGVWTDVWSLREMTTEEKTAVQQEVITTFNNRNYSTNWSAWTLDEATNTMVPPIPRPELNQTKMNSGVFTFWCGADANWKDTPVRPEGEYQFDFFAWQWVEITQ